VWPARLGTTCHNETDEKRGPMTDLQKLKQNAVKSLVAARTADMLERLIEQVKEKVPPTQIFTRDDLIELLQGMSDRMREEQQ
jgi:hypothetical protein